MPRGKVVRANQTTVIQSKVSATKEKTAFWKSQGFSQEQIDEALRFNCIVLGTDSPLVAIAEKGLNQIADAMNKTLSKSDAPEEIKTVMTALIDSFVEDSEKALCSGAAQSALHAAKVIGEGKILPTPPEKKPAAKPVEDRPTLSF